MSDTLQSLLEKLDATLEKKDFDKTIEISTQIINHPDAKDDAKTIAYESRGIAYFGKDEYDNAIRDYNKAVELKPDNARAYRSRGDAYNNKGEYEQSIQDYDKAIELKPDDATIYLNRGNAYNDKGEHERAIQDYDKAIELKPDDAGAYLNRGVAYNRKGEYDEAIQDYDKAIELKPDDAMAYSNRAAAYNSKGEYDRAIQDCNKAIEIKPDYKGAIHNRGVTMALKLSEETQKEISAKYEKELEEQQEKFERDLKEKVEAYRGHTLDEYLNREEKYRTKKEKLEKRRPFLYLLSIVAALVLYGFTAHAYLRIHGLSLFTSDPCEGMIPKPYLYETKAHPESTTSDIPASCPDEPQPDTAKTNQDAPGASTLPLLGLLPFILMATLILSPVAWYIRILNRRIEKLWALEEHSYSNYQLVTQLVTAKDGDPDIKKELLKKFFDHHDKRGSSHLIADWDRPTEKDSNDTPSKP